MQSEAQVIFIRSCSIFIHCGFPLCSPAFKYSKRELRKIYSGLQIWLCMNTSDLLGEYSCSIFFQLFWFPRYSILTHSHTQKDRCKVYPKDYQSMIESVPTSPCLPYQGKSPHSITKKKLEQQHLYTRTIWGPSDVCWLISPMNIMNTI